MSKVDAAKFRYEKKYLIDAETAFILKQRLSRVLSPDEYGDNGQCYACDGNVLRSYFCDSESGRSASHGDNEVV